MLMIIKKEVFVEINNTTKHLLYVICKSLIFKSISVKLTKFLNYEKKHRFEVYSVHCLHRNYSLSSFNCIINTCSFK